MALFAYGPGYLASAIGDAIGLGMLIVIIGAVLSRWLSYERYGHYRPVAIVESSLVTYFALRFLVSLMTGNESPMGLTLVAFFLSGGNWYYFFESSDTPQSGLWAGAMHTLAALVSASWKPLVIQGQIFGMDHLTFVNPFVHLLVAVLCLTSAWKTHQISKDRNIHHSSSETG